MTLQQPAPQNPIPQQPAAQQPAAPIQQQAPEATAPQQQPQFVPPQQPVQQQQPPQQETHWSQSFSQAGQQPPLQAPVEQQQFEQQPTSPEQQVNPLFTTAQGLGIEIPENATVDQIAEASLQALKSAQPYAHYGQSLMPYSEQINAALNGQAQQAETPPAPTQEEWDSKSYFNQRWDTPDWNPQFDDMINRGIVRRDEATGDYIAAPGYETMVGAVLPQLNNALSAQNRQWRSFMRSNPYEQMYESLLEPLKRQWQADMDQRLNSHQEQTAQQSYVQSWEEKNAEWLYDQSGNFTQQGQAFANAYQDVLNSGVQNKQKALEMAARMVPRPEQSAPVQQQPPAQNGHVPVPGQQPPQQQGQAAPSNAATQTFLEAARERAQQQPSSNGHYAPQSNDPPQSQGELESLFTSAYRASQAQNPAA